MTAEPPSISHDEKRDQQPTLRPATELLRSPTIAFDDQGPLQLDIEERPLQHVVPRSGNNNLEMRREWTQEDKELSRANYDHLERQKSYHGEKGADGEEGDEGQADIREHRYTIEQLQETFKTNFSIKNVASSFGLTNEEAAARLVRDGPNALTPPKKRSSFQKVRPTTTLPHENINLFAYFISVYGLSAVTLQHPHDRRRCPRIHFARCGLQGSKTGFFYFLLFSIWVLTRIKLFPSWIRTE